MNAFRQLLQLGQASLGKKTVFKTRTNRFDL